MSVQNPVCWLRTRKSDGEVDTDFDGPIKHIDLFTWEPLYRESPYKLPGDKVNTHVIVPIEPHPETIARLMAVVKLTRNKAIFAYRAAIHPQDESQSRPQQVTKDE